LKGTKEILPPINQQIRSDKVQLITHLGENIGVVPTGKALIMAMDAGLDLVTIADQGKDGVPVVKIMDFGKVLYEKKKKQTEAKKHQKVIQIKEVKIRPKIGDHDYQTKMKQVLEFLNEGKRVKITLFFSGRENATKEGRGTELFEKINKTFEEFGIFKDVIQEKDAKVDQTWSRMYYLKTK